VPEGGMFQITNMQLRAASGDASDSEILFMLTPEHGNPPFGAGDVVLLVPMPADGPSDGWELLPDGRAATPTTSFTQQDINEGIVWYRSAAGTLSPRDAFTFTVTDGAKPPHELAGQVFHVGIIPQHDSPPQLSPGVPSPLRMLAAKDQITVIQSNYLSFVDNSGSEYLLYNVTQLIPPEYGALEHADRPGHSVTLFTQADVDMGKIVYRPGNARTVPGPATAFRFTGEPMSVLCPIFCATVSDGANTSPETEFTLQLYTPSKLPPVFQQASPAIHLTQGGTAPIGLEQLSAEDADSSPEELLFAVLEAPSHGLLTKYTAGRHLTLASGDVFTHDDLAKSALHYVHDGTGASGDDAASFGVSDGVATATVAVAVIIAPTDGQGPRQAPGTQLSITLPEKGTATITASELAYSAGDSPAGQVRFMLTSVPMYGLLVISGAPGVEHELSDFSIFSMEDINGNRIKYKTDFDLGGDPITDLFYFSVTDGQGNRLENQIFTLTITPGGNQPPSLTLTPSLKVDEGGKVMISSNDIMAMDADTPKQELVVKITDAPKLGYILNTKSAETSTNRFLQWSRPFRCNGDVLDAAVFYVQSVHRETEPVYDAFRLHVTDGHSASPSYLFNISIQQRSNDEPPKLVTGTVACRPGEAIVLREDAISVKDMDTPGPELVLTITHKPQHGKLSRKARRSERAGDGELAQGSTFTFQDVVDGLLSYTHDGTDGAVDEFRLSVSDGAHSQNGRVAVSVEHSRSEIPRMAINRGLQIQAGSAATVTAQQLQAMDVDSDTLQLKFFVVRDAPVGRLLLAQAGPKGGSKGQQTQQQVSVKGPVKSFTQADVNKGLLEYRHNKGEDGGSFAFKFDIVDQEGNKLIDQSFHITILEDRLPPVVEVNKELVVEENSVAKLGTELLSVTDADTEPGQLLYRVARGPSLGRLEMLANPGRAVTAFSQADLAARRVQYVHTSSQEKHDDDFTFTVSDGSNEVRQTMRIRIAPVDDSLPVVQSLGMRVQEGVRKPITEFELKATDADTQPDSITFTVVQPPRHGAIERGTGGGAGGLAGAGWQAASTFTMEDVYQGRVSYSHDGSNTLRDNFAFTVGDGTNPLFVLREGSAEVVTALPQKFQIEILPVDDGTPRIVTNLGLQWLEYIEGKAANHITKKELLTLDPDTDDTQLVYEVTSNPKHGHLENKLKPGVPVKAFTQGHTEEVNLGVLRYVLEEGKVEETVDSFRFSVRDSKPNVVSDNVFHIQWSIISFQHRRYNASETAGTVSVTVKRRGNLNQYAIVLCRTEPGTATSSSGAGSRRGAHDYVEYAAQVRKQNGPRSTAHGNMSPAPGHARTKSERWLQWLWDPSLHRSHTKSTDSELASTTRRLARSVKKREHGKIPDTGAPATPPHPPVALAEPSPNARLGERTTARVVIAGPNDASLVHLGDSAFSVSEDAGTVDVPVVREGSDLSAAASVWCATRPSEPLSATPAIDYVATSRQVLFAPGRRDGTCTITILDDTQHPVIEGGETFVVFLSSPQGVQLTEPSHATVLINDTYQDTPALILRFACVSLASRSNFLPKNVLHANDLIWLKSVRCFTRRGSARVDHDYTERPDTDASRITFLPGEKTKNCTVRIVDDTEFEGDEEFRLHLGSALGSQSSGAKIGKNDVAIITITNEEDAPTIQFEEASYQVREPSGPDGMAILTILVLRSGDRNKTSKVRCSTRDGSAQSGMDYNPKSRILKFLPGVEQMEFPVEILANEDREWHESFSVVLGPDDPVEAVLGDVTTATVTILDQEATGSLILPAPPIVVSLADYDSVEEVMKEGSKKDPSPGYPLVCVTPCDPHYPKYSLTRERCEEAGINQSALYFSWEVSSPTDANGARSPFETVTDHTPFTSVNHKVLESVYFGRRFHVRCVAQARDRKGQAGTPLRSNTVTVGTDNSICHTPVSAGSARALQAQSFIASLEYLDVKHEEHPNRIHISIQIPHQDGMLPLISTMPIHNLHLLLSESIYRQQHVCSNLVSLRNLRGVTDSHRTAQPRAARRRGGRAPVENQTSVGGFLLLCWLSPNSVIYKYMFYRNAGSRIGQPCFGGLNPVMDFQRADQILLWHLFFLSTVIILTVATLYPAVPNRAPLENKYKVTFRNYFVTFLYLSLKNTNTLNSIYLDFLTLHFDYRLSLHSFKRIKFAGQFVMEHHTLPAQKSHLAPPDHLGGIELELELVWSAQTFDSPYQLWRATSSYNRKDYSGEYTVYLIPCTVQPTQPWLDPGSKALSCTAQAPEKFLLPISFQQTNRPVPVVYSLNTEFHLCNNDKVFLLDPGKSDVALPEMDYKGAFSMGQTLYGRVLWNPDQNLKSAYKLQLEKVYLCTGRDGYVPFFDPTGTIYNEGPQYGCIQPNKHLKHRFLLLDRNHPEAVDRYFHDVPFEAGFASDVPEFQALWDMPGVDGFSMKVDALYKVAAGHQWYLQVIYLIGPESHGPRLRRSASIGLPSRRRRRDLLDRDGKLALHDSVIYDEDESLGAGDADVRNGTNMKTLQLQQSGAAASLGPGSGGATAAATAAAAAVSALAVAAAVATCLACVAARRRRARAKEGAFAGRRAKAPVDYPLNTAAAAAATADAKRVDESERPLNPARTSALVKNVNLLNKNDDVELARVKGVKVTRVNLEVKVQNNLHDGTEV
uniref:Fraser extracellular matrix complex subunit 1 n=1 Tax=Petromyzon marinus TaxID=7757 RepID=S4RN57_PETMA